MEIVNQILLCMRKKAKVLSIVGAGDDLIELADRLEAAIKLEREAGGKEEDAEIRDGMLKSIAECDTSITGWSVEYTQDCVIPKVKIPRAVYEILLAAFREVCRVKLVLRKD